MVEILRPRSTPWGTPVPLGTMGGYITGHACAYAQVDADINTFVALISHSPCVDVIICTSMLRFFVAKFKTSSLSAIAMGFHLFAKTFLVHALQFLEHLQKDRINRNHS